MEQKVLKDAQYGMKNNICLAFSKRQAAVDIIYISAWFHNTCTAAADSTMKQTLRIHSQREKRGKRPRREEKCCKKKW